ncbi:hypothetical protein MMC22_010465 [Lobaria immixta]|nr:hypothetical protein [Lobaria immixta]
MRMAREPPVMETRETLWIKPNTILSILTCSQCLENDGHLRQTIQENMSVVLAAFRNLKAGYNTTVNAHDRLVDDVEELDVEIAQLEATLNYPQGEMEHLQEIIQESRHLPAAPTKSEILMVNQHQNFPLALFPLALLPRVLQSLPPFRLCSCRHPPVKLV